MSSRLNEHAVVSVGHGEAIDEKRFDIDFLRRLGCEELWIESVCPNKAPDLLSARSHDEGAARNENHVVPQEVLSPVCNGGFSTYAGAHEMGLSGFTRPDLRFAPAPVVKD